LGCWQGIWQLAGNSAADREFGSWQRTLQLTGNLAAGREIGSWQGIDNTTDGLESSCEDFSNLPDISLPLCMEAAFLSSTQTK